MINGIEAKHLDENVCMRLELTDTNVKRTFLVRVSICGVIEIGFQMAGRTEYDQLVKYIRT